MNFFFNFVKNYYNRKMDAKTMEKVKEYVKTMSKTELKLLMISQLDGSIRLPFEYIILVYMKSEKFSQALPKSRDLQGIFENVKRYQDKLIERYKNEIYLKNEFGYGY